MFALPVHQNTIGTIFLALISYGTVDESATMPPFWVVVACAIAIALGTLSGGWRVIRTLARVWPTPRPRRA